ncbi:choice-of-anchor D domain-containing protein [Acidicapsa ligni]|uniref:choice-of-anchor D domain-containing protein n=1 Tax=Acidicapsa ligni TaxID=542300 RepID=UPI0021DFBC00|nr:choice-of-anchor D domain-containing protein [Acidicapsa ligni]
MHSLHAARIVAGFVLGVCTWIPTFAQNVASENAALTEFPVVASRVVEHVDDARLTRLSGNTHPMARPEFDKGPVDSGKLLERIVLVLKRSPEQEAALAAFNERQYDPKSPDFHHWLHADEFGKLYGPSDADVAAVTSWLQNHGFQIYEVGKGRVWIQFTGTVGQVEEAFHIEMRNYLVGGKMHIANDRDPQIPEALSPVITGIASLHDFMPRHYSHPGDYVKRDLKTGKYTVVKSSLFTGGSLESNPESGAHSIETSSLAGRSSSSGVQPEFGYVDPSTGYQREELSPYDVATIYNILPLWNASAPITGKGVKVAIVALSDVETADFNTYRSSFGLPTGTLVTLHSGADPGITDSQGENTEDTEMVSATAPGAEVVLVADVDNATTNGLVTAITYIVDNEVAPILTMSYGECELENGTSGNSLFNQTFQQAATAGISSFVAAGDSGSAVCTSQNGTPPYADTFGLQVSGMASTPYVTAVGGTDLQWPFVEATNAPSTYWNATNDSHGASAKGYMPEMSWNDTCSNPLLLNVYTSYSSPEALCNAAIDGSPGLVEMASGSGGASACIAPTGTTPATCAAKGGYAKPSWQTGVSGIPADGKRDLPDVSMFAAYGFQQSTGIPGSALLICQATASPETSCDYTNPGFIIYQENGGTSAASPMTAGVMALVVQKTGKSQGLANPVFYSLAAKENYAACNSNTVKAGNSCIFYDTTSGSNAAVCITGDPNCVTKTSGDQVGILSGYSATSGYDLTTGLGTFNVANLVNAWPTSAATTPTVSISPTSLTFASTLVGATTAAQVVTIKNTGTTAATLTSETLTGTNATSFVKSATTCTTSLAAAASCTVSVEFKPTVAGSLTASLSVADNATGSPQTIAIKGTATAAPLTITLSPTTLTFASTKVGTATAAQVVTIKNTSATAVTITSETLTGTNATSFVKSATTCTTSLAASASCTVSIEFKPTVAGSLTASLSVADNATGTPQIVALKGTATAVPLTVTLSPTTLTFASTNVGTATAAQVVTIKNTSATAVTITSETLTGTNATSFVKAATTCTTSLAASASCTVSVEFKPTVAGSLITSLSVADNATGSPQTVALKGTAVASVTPSVTLTPTTIAFPSTIIGVTTDAQIVILKNTSSAAVTISSIVLGGTNPADFVELSSCGTSLAASATCNIYIAFKPVAAAAYSATVSVTDNATGSPQKITLTGTGTAAPSVTLSTKSLAFASTTHGTTSAAQTVTLKNAGTATVNLNSITLSGTNATSYELLDTCGPTLAGGASCMVYVAFKPATTGTLTATLSVADNGSASPQAVSLTGTGK